MSRLAGKVAIVTGAASGLGKAIATRMAEQGASVAILDVNEAGGRSVAAELAARSLVARFWSCAVNDDAQVARVIAEVADAHGKLSVLVNNAGIGLPEIPTHELTEEQWDRTQAVNVKGVFHCTKHAVPHMRAAGGGSIINISSIAAMVGGLTASAYHASKGAIRAMSKTDAVQYAPDRIRVNAILPGIMMTPAVEAHYAALNDGGAAFRTACDRQPLGVLGDPDDIAWGAVYLASDEAKFVTGSELVIDGGYTAR